MSVEDIAIGIIRNAVGDPGVKVGVFGIRSEQGQLGSDDDKLAEGITVQNLFSNPDFESGGSTTLVRFQINLVDMSNGTSGRKAKGWYKSVASTSRKNMETLFSPIDIAGSEPQEDEGEDGDFHIAGNTIWRRDSVDGWTDEGPMLAWLWNDRRSFWNPAANAYVIELDFDMWIDEGI